MAVASYVSPVSPPPFAAQFAEVTVDIETGQVTVDRLVMAVDFGRDRQPADSFRADRRRNDPGPGVCSL